MRMNFASRARNERGVSAIFFGLAVTVLIGGLGLSVDIGNVAYQRSKAQHAADSAARQIALACAKEPAGATCADPDAAATAIAADNIDGGVADATISGSDVTVTVDKTVATSLLAMIGVETKDVAATATASSAASHVVSVSGILPLGVSYCTWKNNAGFAGTSTEADHKTAIRTDTLQSLRNMVSPLDTSSLRGLLDTGGLLDYLDTKAVDKCAEEDGTQLGTFKGAVWLTGESVVGPIIKGLFGWDAAKCELSVDNELSAFLGGLQGSALLPPGCPQHFGNGKLVDKGNVILLPIFKPRSELQERYGLKLATVCASLLGPSKTCVEVPPKIGLDIVGFAPFHVTGWKYPGNPANVDASVACSDIGMSFNLKNVLLQTLSLVELVLNLGLSIVNGLLSSGLTASITCNGLQGYFTKTYSPIDGAIYGPGADEFGTGLVKLTQ